MWPKTALLYRQYEVSSGRVSPLPLPTDHSIGEKRGMEKGNSNLATACHMVVNPGDGDASGAGVYKECREKISL